MVILCHDAHHSLVGQDHGGLPGHFVHLRLHHNLQIDSTFVDQDRMPPDARQASTLQRCLADHSRKKNKGRHGWRSVGRHRQGPISKRIRQQIRGK